MGRALIYPTGMGTQIDQIVALTKQTSASDSLIRHELHHFIRVIGAIAVFLGVAFFAASPVMGKEVIAPHLRHRHHRR